MGTYRVLRPQNLFSEFDHLFSHARPTSSQLWRPSVHSNESEEKVELSFELAGFAKDQLKVDIEDNELIISGETEFFNEKREFTKRYELYDGLDREAVSVSFLNGILKIEIPKIIVKPVVKSLEIKTDEETHVQ